MAELIPTTSTDSAAQHSVTYQVNGEPFTTARTRLTVREILTTAGFTPVEQYQLIRDNGHKVLEPYDLVVPVHHEESFTALYNGPTPTS